MAGEIQASFAAGKTTYSQIRSRTGTIWNTSGGTGAFEVYATANISSYAVSLSEQGSASAFYIGTFPPAIPAGIFSVLIKQQIGGSVAESDPTVAVGDLQWNGSVTLPISDLSTSGQVGQMNPLRVARGTQVLNFPFKLVSSADHVSAFTSGVVSGQISRDGGSFGPLQSGTIAEVGLGWYKTTLTSGDLLANTVALTLTAVGISGGSADAKDYALVLQRTSGQ